MKLIFEDAQVHLVLTTGHAFDPSLAPNGRFMRLDVEEAQLTEYQSRQSQRS